MVKFTSRLYIRSTIRVVPTKALALEAHAQLFSFSKLVRPGVTLVQYVRCEGASSTALTNDDEDHQATAAGL